MPAFYRKQNLGAHRFDFAITLVIISVLATLLLYSVNRIQTNIKRLTHEAELNNIRLAIAESWVHKHAMHESVNIKNLVNTNPMHFINEVPKNYIGERSTKPIGIYTIWYYDTLRKQLVYVYNDDTEVRYALISTTKNRASLLSVGGLDLAPVGNQ